MTYDYHTSTKEDWLYSTERLALRRDSLHILLRMFGSHIKEDGTPEHSTESIYACAHDWVSQGNVRTDGIMAYFNGICEQAQHMLV